MVSVTADNRSGAGVLKLVTPLQSGVSGPRLQRSQGEVRLAFKKAVDDCTALDDLYQQGGMKVRLAPGTCAAITTQACERIYKSSAGSAHVSSRIAAGAGATVCWVPQETILFNGASLSRRMFVDLAADARLVACEAIILGRPAMGEYVHCARLFDEWTIARDGRTLFVDRLGLDGNLSADLNRPGVGNGARSFASIKTAGPDIAGQCEQARSIIAGSGLPGGASQLDGVMLARVLAPNSHELRAVLLPLMDALSGGPLPRAWHM